MSTAKQFAALLQAAARQRSLMQPWSEDRRYQAGGGQILYAVDTDVVILFGSPWTESIATKKRAKGYAQVFPGDDKDLSIALGQALAEHLFFHLSRENFPLLLLPPMEEEVKGAFDWAADEARKEQVRAGGEHQALSRAWINGLSKEKDPQEIMKSLADEAPALARLLVGRTGHVTELKRLRRLAREGRLMPLDFALEEGWIKDPTLQERLAPPSGLEERMEFRDMRENWFDLLRAAKRETISNTRIYADAQVLARLEWVNERLSGSNAKLLFITGDAALHKAARGVTRNKTQNFAELYLRHPRAYLAEPGVLSPMVRQGGENVRTPFLDWLDVFLNDARTEGHAEPEKMTVDELETCAASLLNPNIARDFRGRWDEYTRHLVLSHLEGENNAYQGALGKLQGSVDEILKQIGEKLSEKLEETWLDCFGTATEAGWGLLFHQSQKGEMRQRNPPILCSDNCTEAQDFVTQLVLSRPSGEGINQKTYKQALEALKEQDPSGYMYYLAYAALFAAEGRWRVTDILAKIALQIADTRRPEWVSGREAAYFHAISVRHSARKAKELKEVGKYLDECDKRLAEERIKRPGLPGGEMRFNAERAALTLTYHLFHLFRKERVPAGLPSLESLQADILAQLDKPYHEEKKFIRSYVERHLLTNLFTTALLRCHKLKEPVDKESLRPAFKQFAASVEDDGEYHIQPSFLAKAVHLAAAYWLSKTPGGKEFAYQKLRLHLDDEYIRKNCVFPYDKARFEFLREKLPG